MLSGALMPAAVRLTVTAGPLEGEDFAFGEPAVLVVGAPDASTPYGVEDVWPAVSPRHCIFQIDPPRVSVRDAGGPQRDLLDGDDFQTGATGLRVGVVKAGAEPGADAHSGLIARLRRAGSGAERLDATCGYQISRELTRHDTWATYLTSPGEHGEPGAVTVALPGARAGHAGPNPRRPKDAPERMHLSVRTFRAASASERTLQALPRPTGTASVEALMADRGGKLAVEEAVGIACQALDGLAYVHAAEMPSLGGGDAGVRRGGILHRALAPMWLLVSAAAGGRLVTISGFRLSHALDPAEAAESEHGGPGAGFMFMPRQELIDFRRSKPEVDVWAMAACLYGMLTGEPPREFGSSVDPALTVLERDPVPIRERDPGIPGPLADVIDEALVEEPEIRFKSAAELKRALQEAC